MTVAISKDTSLATTEEERRTLDFLHRNYPDLAQAYIRELPRARRTTLAHLTAAVLRENLGGLADRSQSIRIDPLVLAPNNGRLVHPLRALASLGTRHARIVPLTVSSTLLIAITAESAFSHAHVVAPLLHINGDDCEELVEPGQLLQILELLGVGGPNWDGFCAEIAESDANLALSYACVSQRSSELLAIAQQQGVRGIGELLTSLYQANGVEPHLLLEALCAEGHNLHPCGRVRMGMSPEENYRYAAECQGQADLVLVAVRSDHLLLTDDEQGRGVEQLLFEHFPSLQHAVRDEIRRRGIDEADYTVLLVHPWQAAHALPKIYHKELAEGTIVMLSDVTLPTTASASLRTVVTYPGARGQRLAIKASVDVLITSTRRGISPATTYNGPRVSRLLDRLINGEVELRSRVAALSEMAGACFNSDALAAPQLQPGRGTTKQRNLSVLLREDCARYVSPGEIAVTGCALYAESPITARSVLADFVVEDARRRSINEHDAALLVLRDYIDLLIPTCLIFLVKYGIGLELHLQNTVIVFRNGHPVKILLRDFGGLRVHPNRLGASGSEYRPLPDSGTVTHDIDKVRAVAFYTVLQANLAEVVTRLSLDFEIPEATGWLMVWQRAEECFATLAADPAIEPQALEDRAAMTAATLWQKALLRMRVAGDGIDAYNEVPNPLHHLAALTPWSAP